MNTGYLLPSADSSFSLIALVHVLLDLYLSFHFLSATVNGVVFVISNSNFSLLLFSEATDFRIFTL